MNRLKPHLALLVCNVLWAMDYPFYNIVLPHYVHPMAMVSASLVATALFSLVPLLWQKAEKGERADIRKLIGAALLIGVLRKVFIMYGLSMTSPIDGSIIDTIVPLLVLLLSALYEADEVRGMEVCPAHPLRKHFYWQTRYTEYAADMNVVLAYNNCRDDWQDDGSALKYWEAEALSARCAAVRARWPRQCAAIEQCMAELSAIEQADTGDPDAAANCFGRLMGELFVTDDLWDARLRPFGEALGRFIYLLDAGVDLPEDLRHGRYNPLRTLPQDADLHALLTMLLGECSTAFEALPVLQDVELLRNILYSGVWLRYEAAMKKRKIGRSAE